MDIGESCWIFAIKTNFDGLRLMIWRKKKTQKTKDLGSCQSAYFNSG